MVNFSDAVSAYKQVATGDTIKPQAQGDVQGDSFADALKGVAQGTVNTLNTAESKSLAAAAGEADIGDVVTAVSEAEVTLQTVVAVRDKVVTAYQEILKMPI